MTQQPAGWYADPTGRHTHRYWDGSQWLNQVSDGGTSGLDPTELDSTTATTPPAPGTKAPGAQTTPSIEVTQKSGMGIGTLVGILVAVAIVIFIAIALMNDSGDDGTTPATDAPATTVAPATTQGS